MHTLRSHSRLKLRSHSRHHSDDTFLMGQRGATAAAEKATEPESTAPKKRQRSQKAQPQQQQQHVNTTPKKRHQSQKEVPQQQQQQHVNMTTKKRQRSQKGEPRNRTTVDKRVQSPGSGRNWRKGKHTSTTTTVRSDQMLLMHGQLASRSTAADDWYHTEVGEESEMDSQHDFQEC